MALNLPAVFNPSGLVFGYLANTKQNKTKHTNSKINKM